MGILKNMMLLAVLFFAHVSPVHAGWKQVDDKFCGTNTFTLRSNTVEDITTSNYDTAIHYLKTKFRGRADVYARDDSWHCHWIPTGEFYGWMAVTRNPYYARPIDPPVMPLPPPRHNLEVIVPLVVIPFFTKMMRSFNHRDRRHPHRYHYPPHSHPYNWGRPRHEWR